MAFELTFSQYFNIKPSILDKFGAFDMCIDSDLPLFIDPFLLFASEKLEYQVLHEQIVDHLIYLKMLAIENPKRDLRIFTFPERKQNWFGMCKYGNNGKGLGPKFAKDLIKAFNGYYSNFGNETNLQSSHIEKLTLVGKGIGKDFISDFTANLAMDFLLGYTETFALRYLNENQIREFVIRSVFDKDLGIWKPKKFKLPYFYKSGGDFMILTPSDILTKDHAYICNADLYSRFRQIASSLDNGTLRDAINSYFRKKLPLSPKVADFNLAVTATLEKYPEVLDQYILTKEQEKYLAAGISKEKVTKLRNELLQTLDSFCNALISTSDFFSIQPTSYSEALQRVIYMKDSIENNDGYRIFYQNGLPVAHEDTIQRIFRLTWFASPHDVNSEVNNGRGPADYKISMSKDDSTIVEFKLGKSTSLESNLKHQVEIYKKASKSISDITVILCYSKSEILRVDRILQKLKIAGAENIVLIDASPKISASKVI